jgi:DNA-binding transcriptional LysR family regulator
VPGSPRIGEPVSWHDAAQRPLCMLTPEMHNRAIVDASFAAAGARVAAAIETNSVLTLLLAVVAGEVCSVMPGALVAMALHYPELQALPLTQPQVLTPIGLLLPAHARRSLAQQAAIKLAQEPPWLAHAAAHSGPLT